MILFCDIVREKWSESQLEVVLEERISSMGWFGWVIWCLSTSESLTNLRIR